jgi:predicted alpha/beta hydrolase
MADDGRRSYSLNVSFPDGSSTDLAVLRTDLAPAPVVLCLPAMGVRSRYYQTLGEVLAASGFHAVLADLRGSGASSVRPSRRVSFGYAEILEMELPAIVEAVCREFGTEQVIVVGHSLGGQMGLLLAATSDRVSQAVIVASGSAWYRKVPGIRSVGRFLGLQLMFATTLVWGHLPKWIPFAGREARRLMLDWGFESMTGRYRVSRSSTDYESALACSTVPALFVLLPGDSFVPAPCTRHLAEKLRLAPVEYREIPAAEFRLEKTDHFRWAARPHAVVAAAAEWLTKTQDGGPRGEREPR